MSTILDALKRLDEETRARDAKQVSVVMAGGETAAGGSPERRRRVFFICLAVMVMGAVVLWGYRGGGKEPSLKASSPDTMVVSAIPKTSKNLASITPTPEGNFEKASPTSQPKVDVAPLKPVLPMQARPQKRTPPPSTLYPNSERKKTERISPESSSVESSAGMMRSEPKRSADQTATPRLQAPDARSHMPKSAAINPQQTSLGNNKKTPLSSKAIPISSQPKLRNPPPKSSASQPPSVQDPYANAESFASDTLQVQAISWSDLPNKRIAVIDGRILRESQVVNGYNVIRIRPEDVIVEKSGKYFKLAFGSR